MTDPPFEPPVPFDRTFDALYGPDLVASLTAPCAAHTVIFGTSDNDTRWWDNTRAAHIGYRPQDSSEVFRAAVEARQAPLDMKDPLTLYQGGGFVTKGPYE